MRVWYHRKVATLIYYYNVLYFYYIKMEETIKSAIVTTTLNGVKYESIITKADDWYWVLLRMWTKVEWDYKKAKDFVGNLFDKIGWETKTKPVEKPTRVKHRWRPKGKPRWPRKPVVIKRKEIKKASELTSEWFISRFIKKQK